MLVREAATNDSDVGRPCCTCVGMRGVLCGVERLWPPATVTRHVLLQWLPLAVVTSHHSHPTSSAAFSKQWVAPSRTWPATKVANSMFCVLSMEELETAMLTV